MICGSVVRKRYCEFVTCCRQWLLTGNPHTHLPIVQLNSHSTQRRVSTVRFFVVVLTIVFPLHYPSSSRIYSHTPRVASLNTAMEELIHTSSTENAPEVQEDLKDLNVKCFLFWIAENWAPTCSAKPIIELDICYIAQKYQDWLALPVSADGCYPVSAIGITC